jgi:hypothetical protein
MIWTCDNPSFKFSVESEELKAVIMSWWGDLGGVDIVPMNLPYEAWEHGRRGTERGLRDTARWRREECNRTWWEDESLDVTGVAGVLGAGVIGNTSFLGSTKSQYTSIPFTLTANRLAIVCSFTKSSGANLAHTKSIFTNLLVAASGPNAPSDRLALPLRRDSEEAKEGWEGARERRFSWEDREAESGARTEWRRVVNWWEAVLGKIRMEERMAIQERRARGRNMARPMA